MYNKTTCYFSYTSYIKIFHLYFEKNLAHSNAVIDDGAAAVVQTYKFCHLSNMKGVAPNDVNLCKS